ncbi:hypothetical protein BASA81_012070 [Batrachochytrium salamandrivorans]|nr:hypothetical protein BASA81_012070 [Batrachochytrium salamandrivorans]
MVPFGMMILNLLQLEIFAIFNGGLIHWSTLERDNIKWIRCGVIVLHLICTGPCYLSVWAIPVEINNLQSNWTTYGSGLYCGLIALYGIVQDAFILYKVNEHLNRLNSRKIEGASSSSRDLAMTSLIIAALIFVIMGVTLFGASVIIPAGGANNLLHFVLMQFSISFVGIHMFVETFLFERIVAKFRNEPKPPQGKNANVFAMKAIKKASIISSEGCTLSSEKTSTLIDPRD